MTRAEEFDLALAARAAAEPQPRIIYPDTTPRTPRVPTRADRVNVILTGLADQRRIGSVS